jgi:hypothetical protein
MIFVATMMTKHDEYVGSSHGRVHWRETHGSLRGLGGAHGDGSEARES